MAVVDVGQGNRPRQAVDVDMRIAHVVNFHRGGIAFEGQIAM